jgi:hypothetical protein
MVIVYAERLESAAAAPPCVRVRAESNLRDAQSFGDKADMTLRFVRWLDGRGRLQAARDNSAAQAALDELEKIGREELAADNAALPRYLRDSRLGWLNHGRGCFTAMSILQKMDLLEQTLNVDLPALRANKGGQMGDK